MGFFDFLPWVDDDAPAVTSRKPAAPPRPAPVARPLQRTSSGRAPARPSLAAPAVLGARRVNSARNTLQPSRAVRAGNEKNEGWNWFGLFDNDEEDEARNEYNDQRRDWIEERREEQVPTSTGYVLPGGAEYNQSETPNVMPQSHVETGAIGDLFNRIKGWFAEEEETPYPGEPGKWRKDQQNTAAPPAAAAPPTTTPIPMPGAPAPAFDPATLAPGYNPTPGVPGPETAVNNARPLLPPPPPAKEDRRNRSGPELNLTNTLDLLLKQSGWETPDRERAFAPINRADFDYEHAVDLKGYDYQLTNDEWAMLQNTAEGAKGYARSKSAAGAPPTARSQSLRAVPMTWDAYNALSDQQRKAVDYNTLLVEARQKDIGQQNPGAAAGNPTEYGEKVKRIFGEGGGSARPAANTVNLLDKIGLEAKGQDLDEFLSLDRAITLDELQEFKFSEGEVVGLTGGGTPKVHHGGKAAPAPGLKKERDSNFGEVRNLENTGRIETSAIDKAGAFIEGLMNDPNAKLWDFKSTTSTGLTGQRPPASEIPFGFGLLGERTGDDEVKEQTYRLAYEYLTNRGNTDLEAFWAELSALEFTDEDVQDLWEVIDRRSRADATADGDPSFRSGAEVREFAGLGG